MKRELLGVVLASMLIVGLVGAGLLLAPASAPASASIATGDSMGHSGQTVVVHADVGGYAVGDAVVFTSEGHTIHHRIVGESQEGFITQGDAEPVTDQAAVPGVPPVQESQIHGQALVVVPLGAALAGLLVILATLCLVAAVLYRRKLVSTSVLGVGRKVSDKSPSPQQTVAVAFALLLVVSMIPLAPMVGLSGDHDGTASAISESQTETAWKANYNGIADIYTDGDDQYIWVAGDVTIDGQEVRVVDKRDAQTGNLLQRSDEISSTVASDSPSRLGSSPNSSTIYFYGNSSVRDVGEFRKDDLSVVWSTKEGSDIASSVDTELLYNEADGNAYFLYGGSGYADLYQINGDNQSASLVTSTSTSGSTLALHDNVLYWGWWDQQSGTTYNLTSDSTGSWSSPSDTTITMRSDGEHMYIPDFNSNGLYKWDPDTGSTTTQGTFSGLSPAEGRIHNDTVFWMGNNGEKIHGFSTADFTHTYNITASNEFSWRPFAAGENAVFATDGGTLKAYTTSEDYGGEPVSGTVTDADGNAKENATVEIVNASTGSTAASVTTDANGYYEATVDAGEYDITADDGNYTSTKTVDVPEGGVTVDFTLKPADDGKYEQTFILDDQTPDSRFSDADLRIERATDSMGPGAIVTTDDWTVIDTTTFNHNDKAFSRLEDGAYYRLVLTDDYSVWDYQGFEAVEDGGAFYLRPGQLDNQTENVTETNTTAENITLVSGDDGLVIEYEGEPVDSIDYNVTNPDTGEYVDGDIDFDEPTDYYEGGFDDDILTNNTSTSTPDFSGWESDYEYVTTGGERYNGTVQADSYDGLTLDTRNGSADDGGFAAPVGGGSGGSTPTWVIGIPAVAAVGYVVLRRRGAM